MKAIRLQTEYLTEPLGLGIATPRFSWNCGKDEEPMTASGGNIIGAEISRNERSPQCGVATIEAGGKN